jgi:hypothetical protein
MVSASVVQTVGALNCTNGARLTRRGAGSAVRPPTVWTNRAAVPVRPTGSVMTGSATAAKVTDAPPTARVVEPITQPPA